MKTRRHRNDSAHRLAELRWRGCVLLAMFAIVHTIDPPAHAVSIHPAGVIAGRDKPIARDNLTSAHWARGSDPSNLTPNLFSRAGPFAATPGASAAVSDAKAGDVPIQTP